MSAFKVGQWVLVDGKDKGFITMVRWSGHPNANSYTVYIPKFASEYVSYMDRLVPLGIEVFDCPDVVDLALDTNDEEWFAALMEGVKE